MSGKGKKKKRVATVGTDGGKTKASPEDDELFAKVVREVETVLRNATDGDCPFPLDHIWLFVNVAKLSVPGCVTLICNVDQDRQLLGDERLGVMPRRFMPSGNTACGFACSKDADIFNDMGEYGMFVQAAKSLDIYLGGTPSTINQSKLDPQEVADKMVEIATTKELCKEWTNVEVWDDELQDPESAVAARLRKRFAAWLQGVRWHKTWLNPANRPSQASWDGYPWTPEAVMERRCGLGRGLPAGSVLDIIHEQGTTPEKLSEASAGAERRAGAFPTPPGSFLQIWGRKLVMTPTGEKAKEDEAGAAAGAASSGNQRGERSEVPLEGSLGVVEALAEGQRRWQEMLQQLLREQEEKEEQGKSAGGGAGGKKGGKKRRKK
eukprot:g349.t1